MKPLKTGDPCPCCGQPIKTTDPEKLRSLNDLRAYLVFLRAIQHGVALREQEAANGKM